MSDPSLSHSHHCQPSRRSVAGGASTRRLLEQPHSYTGNPSQPDNMLKTSHTLSHVSPGHTLKWSSATVAGRSIRRRHCRPLPATVSRTLHHGCRPLPRDTGSGLQGTKPGFPRRRHRLHHGTMVEGEKEAAEEESPCHRPTPAPTLADVAAAAAGGPDEPHVARASMRPTGPLSRTSPPQPSARKRKGLSLTP
jgi:hypothetical protein